MASVKEKTVTVHSVDGTSKDVVVPSMGPKNNGTAENKADKWKRLVNSRGPKAVKMIRNLCNLGNRNAYDFTDEQAQKLITALTVEVNALKQRLETKGKTDVPTSIV